MKRRHVLGYLGSATLGASVLGIGAPAIVGRGKAQAAPLKIDPKNPEHVHLIHRKLAYSMSAEPSFMWLQATRNGVVDSKVYPFWDMNMGQAFATKDLGGGDYEVTIWSAIFYTDIKTGKFLERFLNPFTGKEVPIRYAAPRVSKRIYTHTGEQREPINRPEMNVTRSTDVGPAWVENDTVWVRGDTATRMEPKDPATAKLSQVNDWSTFMGLLSDVADPKNLSPKSTWIFNDINTWPAWLEMGDQPGNYVSRGLGQKEAKFSAMPASWRKLLADLYPGYAKDPIAPLKG